MDTPPSPEEGQFVIEATEAKWSRITVKPSLQPTINTVNARFFPPLFLAVQEKICQKICLLEKRCADNRHLIDVKVDTNAGGKPYWTATPNNLCLSSQNNRYNPTMIWRRYEST
jgi:hypothetical protein